MSSRVLGWAGTGVATLVVSGALLAGQRARAAEQPVLLVVNKAEGALSLLDPETLQSKGKVKTGDQPHEVTVTADGKQAIVANYGGPMPGNSLSVIDLEGRKETKRVDLGALRRPHGLAELDGKIYFTAEGAYSIGRYDPASGQVDYIRGTGQNGTHMVVATPDGEKLYTANVGSNSVTALSRTLAPGGPKTTQITVGQAPEGIAVSPDGKEVWVGHRGSGLVVIDTATDKVVEEIQTPDQLLRLAYTPDGKYVVGSNSFFDDVVVYEAARRQEIRRIKVGKGPGGLLIHPDGKRAYVAVIGEGKIAAVDLEKFAVTTSAAVGAEPDGLAWGAPRPAATRTFKRQGALGLAAAPVPPEVVRDRKLEEGVGLFVAAVVPNSAAMAAGAKEGDILLSIDGVVLKQPADFVGAVSKKRAGDELVLEVLRGAEKLTLKPVLTERPRE